MQPPSATLPVLAGVAAAGLGRAALHRALLAKFRRDVRRLNGGDYRGLLSSYAPDAVLVFNEGDHRWSGEHRGRDAIEAFLKDFVAAGIQGEIVVARFDDVAKAPGGERLYQNRTVLVLTTRWGRVVRPRDLLRGHRADPRL